MSGRRRSSTRRVTRRTRRKPRETSVERALLDLLNIRKMIRRAALLDDESVRMFYPTPFVTYAPYADQATDVNKTVVVPIESMGGKKRATMLPLAHTTSGFAKYVDALRVPEKEHIVYLPFALCNQDKTVVFLTRQRVHKKETLPFSPERLSMLQSKGNVQLLAIVPSVREHRTALVRWLRSSIPRLVVRQKDDASVHVYTTNDKAKAQSVLIPVLTDDAQPFKDMFAQAGVSETLSDSVLHAVQNE